MLRHVGERLGDDEVGRSLDRRRQPLAGGQLAADDGRHGSAADDRAERCDQPAIEQDRWRDAADQVANLGQGLARLLLAVGEQLLRGGRIGVDPFAGEAEVDGQQHEPLLGAVVQVALDPVELARLDVEDGRPALLERLHLPSELAALRRAEQPGDHRAMEGHDQLGQRCRDREQREPGERAKQHGRRVAARKRAPGPPGGSAPATASYQTGIDSSQMDRPQRQRSRRTR